MDRKKQVAVTGAAGSLAADTIPTMAEAGWDVIGIDIHEPQDSWVKASCKSFYKLDIQDTESMKKALKNCFAVIHLAGIPLEDDWHRIASANILGTQSVLEAAVSENVERVVLASSIHAVGGQSIPVDPRTIKAGIDGTNFEFVSPNIEMYPTTFYGVSKVALEALGQMYSFRHGLEVVCVRIASRFAEPKDERMLSTWLSPRDAGNLMVAAITSNLDASFVRVWGVSNNTRNYLSLDNGKVLGFTPLDDAEPYAPQILRELTLGERENWDFLLGGIFSSPTPPRMPDQRKDVNNDHLST